MYEYGNAVQNTSAVNSVKHFHWLYWGCGLYLFSMWLAALTEYVAAQRLEPENESLRADADRLRALVQATKFDDADATQAGHNGEPVASPQAGQSNAEMT